MRRTLSIAGLTAALAVCWLMAQPAGDPLLQGLREVEVASVADAMEQLYGQQASCRMKCALCRRRSLPAPR